jgi:membrane associated rhomboid family serine protease
VGIHNRDYYRAAPPRGGDGMFAFGADAPMVRNIIIATVLVYLAQIFIVVPPSRNPQLDGQVEIQAEKESDPEQIAPQRDLRVARESLVEEWLAMDTRKVFFQGQIWRLLTGAFCHSRFSITHILFNMLFLYWFGVALEGMYGGREFLAFYIVAAIIANLAHAALNFSTGSFVGAIGASGAVMGVTALFACHFPRHQILLFFFIPVEVRWLLLFYVIYDLHPVLLELSGTPVDSGIGHAAHLGGLVFGLGYWKFQWSLMPFVDHGLTLIGRKVGPRRHVRLHQPSMDEPQQEGETRLDRQVDEILEKISREGRESLTARERATLDKASKKYRDRQ